MGFVTEQQKWLLTTISMSTQKSQGTIILCLTWGSHCFQTIIQVGRKFRKLLVQCPVLSRVSYKSELHCWRSYPVVSQKTSKEEMAQPLQATYSSAWLSLWWRCYFLYLVWTSVVSPYTLLLSSLYTSLWRAWLCCIHNPPPCRYLKIAVISLKPLLDWNRSVVYLFIYLYILHW